jgi:hypothetical protein
MFRNSSSTPPWSGCYAILMKFLLPAFLAVTLASCDKPTDVSHLDPAPILRENAELKKKVAALEKEKEEIGKELAHAKMMHESAVRVGSKLMGEKHTLQGVPTGATE